MSLKENIEHIRQELMKEEQERKELVRLKERHDIESYRNKALLLHEKALELFKPYKSLIESSQCIPILEELVQLEKLTPVPQIEVGFTYNEGYMTCRSMSLSDGFLNFNKQKDEEILKRSDFGRGESKIEPMDRTDPDSLKIDKCFLYLEWDIHLNTRTRQASNRDAEEEHNERSSKLIKIYFTPSSIQILGKEKEKTLTKENINKNSLEKSISRAYLNPILTFETWDS